MCKMYTSTIQKGPMWLFQFWDLLEQKSYMEKIVVSVSDQREYMETSQRQSNMPLGTGQSVQITAIYLYKSLIGRELCMEK